MNKTALQKYYSLRKKILDPLAWALSKHELYSVMQKASHNTDNILFHAEQYVGRGFYASLHSVQVLEEIRALSKLVQKLQPHVIVEIGTYKGGTLFLWCRSNPNAKLFVSIDLPGGQYGGGYEPSRGHMYREFIYDYPAAKMELMRVDSHHSSTFESLAGILQGKNLDFLYIDGDHSYEGAKQDFQMYAPLVKHGLIAFHDIVTYSHGCGVYKLWEDLKRDFPTQEFILRGSNKGIGVVFIGGTEKLLSSNKPGT